MTAAVIASGCALGMCAAAWFDQWGAFWAFLVVGFVALGWWERDARRR